MFSFYPGDKINRSLFDSIVFYFVDDLRPRLFPFQKTYVKRPLIIWLKLRCCSGDTPFPDNMGAGGSHSCCFTTNNKVGKVHMMWIQLAPTAVLPTCSPPPWCLPSFQFLDWLAIRVHSSPPWPHRPGAESVWGKRLEVCGAHGPLPSYQLPLAVHHYSLQHACKNKKTSVIEQKGFKMLRKHNIPRDNTCFFLLMLVASYLEKTFLALLEQRYLFCQ